jgi:hypothetical protein
VFGLINQIAEQQSDGLRRRATSSACCSTSPQNPGMTRVLIGDALVNEDERLQLRMNQFYDRVELALKQACASPPAKARRTKPMCRRAPHADQLRDRTLAPLCQERLQEQSVAGRGAANHPAAIVT